MNKFDFCPSCLVKAIDIKNGTVRFDHLSTCKLGKVERTPQKGGVYHAKCLGCFAVFLFDYAKFENGKIKDGTWLAPIECPICWAEAEAVRKR